MTTLSAEPTLAPARRDLGALIEASFDTLQVGEFLTASQIANTVELQTGSRPSTGAIVARLFPASGVCTVDNVRPALHPVSQARGAMKVVSFEVNGLRWETAPVRPVPFPA